MTRKLGYPWAHNRSYDVSDCRTAKEVIAKAKLNYTVTKCPLVAQMPYTINGNNSINKDAGEFAYDGNIYRNTPGAYATYRTDTNTPFAYVSEKYTVVQNNDAFNFFDEAIPQGVKWQNAGCFAGGAQIYLTAKLPLETTVGNNDPIENYLVFSNSHDGTSSVNIMFTPIRVHCMNMLNGAIKSADSYIRLKHTTNVKNKLAIGADVLRQAIAQAETAQELYNSLYKIPVTDKEVQEYLMKLNLTDQEIEGVNRYSAKIGIEQLFKKAYPVIECANISMKKVNKLVSMYEYYHTGVAQKEIAGTMWGAYNAVTGYYSNVFTEKDFGRDERSKSLLYGGANKKMQEALYVAHLKVA